MLLLFTSSLSNDNNSWMISGFSFSIAIFKTVLLTNET